MREGVRDLWWGEVWGLAIETRIDYMMLFNSAHVIIRVGCFLSDDILFIAKACIERMISLRFWRDRFLSHLSYDAVTSGFKSVFFSFFSSPSFSFKGAIKNRRKDECNPCLTHVLGTRYDDVAKLFCFHVSIKSRSFFFLSNHSDNKYHTDQNDEVVYITCLLLHNLSEEDV